MRPNKKRLPRFIWAIPMVLAALIANGVVSYRASRRLAHNNQWVVHTMQVMGELETTSLLATRAESTERGYLLTRNPDYLQTYWRSAEEVSDHINRIADLTRDNDGQQNQIPELRRRIGERLEISRNVIELEQGGRREEAMQLVTSDRGKQAMDHLEALITDMRERERRLLAERTKASRESLRAATTSFALASLVAVFFVLGFFFMARRELHERIQAADTLREREAWLQTTLHSIGDAVVATDEKGEVRFINGVAEKLLGYSNQDVAGKPLAQVFPIFNEATGAPTLDPVASVIRRGTISGLANHTILRNHRGEEIPIEDSAAPIFDAQGKVTGVVLVFRDVTEQRRAQDSARTAEKLAAAGRMAATVAHEINNPLEACTNLLYLAQASASHEEIKQYLAAADHELARMAHITRKTLAFYRSSASPVPTNLCTLLEDVVKLYDGRLQSKGVTAEIDCDRDLEVLTVKGDTTQIIANLVSNALDAMDRGGHLLIKVTVESQGTRLEVEDNGSGIPRENLGKVFEPFFTTKQDTGTGLGLWVVKDLVEKQGGTISVASPVNGTCRGTRFSVFLPSAATQAAKPPADKAS